MTPPALNFADGMSEPFAIPHRDGRFLGTMEVSTWRSAVGDVDVLRGLPSPHGEVQYDDLLERAATLRIDGQAVKVASLDDVILSKQTTNRPSDRAALPELESIARRRSGSGTEPGSEAAGASPDNPS